MRPEGAIHAAAARGFAGAGEAYERGRPGYPADAVARLLDELAVRRGTRVLDLAAGTGKLTRILAGVGADVVAVEPVGGMRAVLVDALPGVRTLAGTAEAIPLPEDSVAAATVAQAFHWFDGDRALAEIHRVLAPGGRLGLVWNVRDEGTAWVAELTRILEPYRGSAPRYLDGHWREAFRQTGRFVRAGKARFDHVHEADADTVVARVDSVSFVAALPPETRERALAEVRALLETHPETRGQRSLALPYRVDLYWYDRV